MAIRQVSASLIALSIAGTMPAAPALSRGGDALVGGIIGGIIGGAIVNESQKSKRVVRPRAAAPAYDPARQARREVQTSLNYFGYHAGTPDGVYGRNTRSAIAQYQASLGYPATGELTAFQQQFLIESHMRAQAGGASTLAQISQTPGGASGLLVSWHDEITRRVAPAAPAPMMVATPMAPQMPPPPAVAPVLPAPAPAAAPTAVVAAPPAATFLPAPPSSAPVAAPAAAPLPAPVAAPPAITAGVAAAAAAPAAPSLPSFLPTEVQASLTSHCNQVSMVTGTNGGFATLASLADPRQALDEQFCLARTYAITEGEAIANGVKGVTQAQLAEQCAAFGPVMAAPVALLGSQGPDQAIPAAVEIATGTGMSPAQLTTSGRICLSVGYRTDDMAVALGSALLLTSLGELPYGELVGHHLMKGFGTATNPGLARDWFRIALDSVSNGQQAVFNPGQPERVTLIRALVLGESPAPAPAPVAGGSAAPGKLPGFSTGN